jgi:hypothetical protein
MATQRCIASIKTPYIHQHGFPGHRLGKTRFSHNHRLRVTDGSAGLDLTRPNRHNYRALNSIPVKNRCTIRRTDDLLDGVAGSSYFTLLDLTSGYYQILIFEETRPKTAFQTTFGHLQFKVLIEGLTNAPATFQTVMNSLLHPYIRQFVVVYIDDILIFSMSEAEHQAHVRLVLKVLKREKFFVCKAKSSFALQEIKYLGHIVNKQGIRPDPKKVKAVQTWPVPTNVHDVHSFLGLVGLVIKWGSRIVVPKDKELRSLLISEFHDSKYAGHFGMSRTRVAVGRMFWWKSPARDVAKFVSTCVACQRNKARCHKPYGLLQPLPVPEKPWHTVTFDFIVKLPKTRRGNDSICVFVNKLTKLVHFVACKKEVSAKEFAELYVDHVFRLHGLSREFITDRDSRFTSAF